MVTAGKIFNKKFIYNKSTPVLRVLVYRNNYKLTPNVNSENLVCLKSAQNTTSFYCLLYINMYTYR